MPDQLRRVAEEIARWWHVARQRSPRLVASSVVVLAAVADQGSRWWGVARQHSRRLVASSVVALAIVCAWCFGAAAMFVVSARRDLPSDEAIRHIGDMDQATSVYDDRDAFTFSIFREQRIEVPLTD